MSQPVMPAPQAPQPAQFDPAQLAAMLQQMVAAGQLPGYTLTKDPEPVQPLSVRDFLVALVSRIPWHTEDVHNAVHAAAHALADRLDALEQDLAHIRARLGVYAQPVTPNQAQVLAAQGQPVPAAVAPAPAPQLPQQPIAPQFAPPVMPQQPIAPQFGVFGPAGVPIPPPAGGQGVA